MASADDLQEQLAIATKLNAVIESMARTLSRIEQTYEGQAQQLEKLASAIASVKVGDAAREVDTLSGSVKKLSTQLGSAGKLSNDAMTTLTDKASKAAKTFSDTFPTAVAVGAAALTGFAQGVKNLVNLTKGAIGLITSLGEGLFQVGTAIAAIPLKIFTGLVDLAAANSSGMAQFQQAVEDLRKSFGDLAGPTNKAIGELSRTFKGFNETGLSTFQVFGTLSERMAYLKEVAEGLGATFDTFRTEFKDNGGALLGFQKGLGFSTEGMKALAKVAIVNGKSMQKAFLEVTEQTTALGEAFDISQKVIGKDMATALQDTSHFAQSTVKEIGRASVYARKLGLELDKIVGTLDAFETFDSAAENAAKMSQSFGVTVDAFKLMEAQSPDEQIDMLRKQFRAAGVDATNFSRQQLKLLQSTTGLDAATAKQVFSLNNQGVSLDDLKKKGDSAEKRVMSQAEAMVKLSSSIERMVKTQEKLGSFFDMFTDGFLKGIQNSKEFWGIMRNIEQGLSQVRMVGVALGRDFVKMFPGVQEFLGGLQDFFKPQKFKQLAQSVSDVFRGFFKDLTEGRFSFPEMMDKLKEKFFDFFDSQTEPGRKVISGFKKITKALSTIVAEGIKYVARTLTEGMRFVADLITGKKKLDVSGTGAAGMGAAGFLKDLLVPILQALKDSWPAFAAAGAEMLKAAWEKIVEYIKGSDIKARLMQAGPYIAAIMFGPAFARGVAAAIGSALIKGGTSAISTAFSSGGSIAKTLSNKTAEVAEAAGKMSSAGGSGAAEGVQRAGAVNRAAQQAVQGGDKWGVQDAVKLGLKLVALAGAIAIGGVALALSVVAMKKILDAGGITTLKDAAVPLAVLAAMVLSALPVSYALRIAGKMGAGAIKEIAVGGLVLSAAVGIVGTVGAGLVYVLGKVGSAATLASAGTLMVKMSGVFLAMVPLILASMAIGALASGPQAILLAAAAVGMAAIGAAVAEMATISVSIVRSLAALSVPPDFNQKIDAFLGVMNAVQAFTGSLVRIIEVAQPSFLEFLTGGPTFVEKIDAAKAAIQEMVRGRNGDGGIIGVVSVVLKAVEGLASSPAVVQAAQTFASVMQAVTATLVAMTPSDALIEAGSGVLTKLVSGPDPVNELMVDVTNHMKRMGVVIKDMATNAMSLIQDLLKLPVLQGDAQKVEVVSRLFSAVTSLMQGVIPSPDVMAKFVTTSKTTSGLLSSQSEVSKFDAKGLVDFTATIMEKFQVLIPLITGKVLGKVVEAAGSIDEQKLKGVTVLSNVLGAITQMTGALSSMAKGKRTTLDEDTKNSIRKQVVEEAPGLTELFVSMAQTVPSMINALTKVVSSLPNDKKFTSQLESARQLFDFVSKIPTLGQGIQASGDGTRQLVSNIDSIVGGTVALTGSIRSLSTEGIAPALKAVQDIVKMSNQLEDALEDGAINKIDIPAKLKVLASGVGLGSSGRYTIQNKAVNINVNLQVTINADDLETAMVMRASSRIRERLNFATGNSAGRRGSPDLPDKPDPNLGPINAVD